MAIDLVIDADGHRVLGQNAVRFFGLRPEDLPGEFVYFGKQAVAV